MTTTTAHPYERLVMHMRGDTDDRHLRYEVKFLGHLAYEPYLGKMFPTYFCEARHA